LLATITVDENKPSTLPKVPIEEMRFTPGYGPEETIEAHQIVKTETIVFSMGANRDQAPFPQYYINGKAFAPDRLDFHAEPGQAVEYILINANHNVHPVSTFFLGLNFVVVVDLLLAFCSSLSVHFFL
jgi:FtsP/CotA-like multicopper oxidase with cupredoxin domain